MIDEVYGYWFGEYVKGRGIDVKGKNGVYG